MPMVLSPLFDISTPAVRHVRSAVDATTSLTSVTTTELSDELRKIDHAYAALAGLAIGDALGMPTQSLSREVIVKEFGELVTNFQPARSDHPYAAGLAAATITDDTEQALILANELLRDDPAFDVFKYARELLAWRDSARNRGLLDLLGPSTLVALHNIESGMDLLDTGRAGTTNGAAMRITPVGIATSSADLAALVERVGEVSAPTHNTSAAIGAAAAVAAVVSAGIDGALVREAITVGLRAARIGEGYGEPTPPPTLSQRLKEAVEIGNLLRGVELIDEVNTRIGTSLASNESVPAAFAILAAYRDHSWEACCVAASIGGDCDTIGALVGAMAGACGGSASFPAWAIDIVETTNSLKLRTVSQRLFELRR